MLTKRIIPCLDIKDGRTVKGVNFENLRDAGDAVELGSYYTQHGADELVFLDITATNEKRKTLSALVKKIAAQVNIPFTVGGGISSVEDVSLLLDSGADKISINTSAVKNPNLISDLAKRFGSQCVVVAIDAKKDNGEWKVYLNGGKTATDIDVVSWAKQAEHLGAGEILLTSMNHDGTKNGFALDITEKISNTSKGQGSGLKNMVQDLSNITFQIKNDSESNFHHSKNIEDLDKLSRKLNSVIDKIKQMDKAS